jgi:hypothetical protein
MFPTARFPPTTLAAWGAQVIPLSVGAGRPLEPAFVAATVSTIPSGAPSVATSKDDIPIAAAVAVANESTKDHSKARAWLNKIIPEKLIHYDPSKDPRLLAL